MNGRAASVSCSAVEAIGRGFVLMGIVGNGTTQMGAFSADIGDLKEGDYVVHATHGIGRFLGIREIAQADQKGDFMLLEYHGSSRLYVPLARMDLIQRYRGAGDNNPGLDRLGGSTGIGLASV